MFGHKLSIKLIRLTPDMLSTMLSTSEACNLDKTRKKVNKPFSQLIIKGFSFSAHNVEIYCTLFLFK